MFLDLFAWKCEMNKYESTLESAFSSKKQFKLCFTKQKRFVWYIVEPLPPHKMSRIIWMAPEGKSNLNFLAKIIL